MDEREFSSFTNLYSFAGGLEVPWVPSDASIVEVALENAEVREGDIFVDLGCGDGRVAIEAAKRGAYSVCIELREDLVYIARNNVRENSVSENIEIVMADVLHPLIRRADIIYVYLLPSILKRMSNVFGAHGKSGTRIISLDFEIPFLKPLYIVQVRTRTGLHKLYFYNIHSIK